MIQWITFSGKNGTSDAEITTSSINSPRSLDEYEVNVIDLSDTKIWHNKGKIAIGCDSENDFLSLKTMICNSKVTKCIILLPQNCKHYYHFYMEKYIKNIELKDMLGDLKKIVANLFSGINDYELCYENTETMVGNNSIRAAFYFNNSAGETFSEKSKKSTTVKKGRVYLSTLEINTAKELKALIEKLGLAKEKTFEPDWIQEIDFFDDNKQKDIIKCNQKIIEQANDKITEAKSKLQVNKRYKSILYTSGDELVNVIFDILQDMLGCDLSDFVDEKKADFIFELGDKTYIGEIKGVNHNVKSENVSQLDVHVQSYLDENIEKTGDNIVAMLIINHQKNKKPSEREPIHETQIKLAKRNNSLIIDTINLLEMYQEYKAGNISREDVIVLIAQKGTCNYVESIKKIKNKKEHVKR